MNTTVLEIKLNERQKIAAENLEENILMLAPAGTGKTNTLSSRISGIIQKGLAEPREILCLTFTNRACREMRERVLAVAGDESFGVTVKTIHAFAYLLLREFGKISGAGDTGICDNEDSAEYIREILSANYPVKDEARLKVTVNKLATFFELVKHRMYRERIKDIPEAAARTLRDEPVREKLCSDGDGDQNSRTYRFLLKESSRVMTLYQNLLKENGLYDFHDLILEMGRLLENADVCEMLRGRYRYIHIDEVQDISDVEYDILTRMFPRAVFLLCGDVNQTVYEWRGSVPGIILSRFKRELNAKEISLEQNYRSTPGLVNISERFLRSRIAGQAPPARVYASNDVEIKQFEHEHEQTRWLYNTIKSLDVAGDYSRVAILCRFNSQCEKLSRDFFALNQREPGKPVNFMLVEEFKIFRAKEIKDILAFFSIILGRSCCPALARASGEYFGVGRGVLDKIKASGETSGIRISDFLSPAVHDAGDYFAPLKAALQSGNAVVFDVESTGVDVYGDEIIQAAAVSIDKNARVLDNLEIFIRPSKPVGESVRVHRITDEYLAKNGKPAREALAELSRFLADKVVIGHNVGYDMDILSAELRRHKLPAPRINGIYDTLDISRRYLPDMENHKLETLSARLDTPRKPSHDAMEDILATADALIALYSNYIAPSATARTLVYRQYAERFAGVRERIDELRRLAPELSTDGLCRHVIEAFAIKEKYADDTARLANIESFAAFMGDSVFNLGWWKRNLSTVVEYSALSSSEFDRLSKASGKMSIITVHQAKGCEFDYVFIPSLVKYSFPSFRSEKNSGGKAEEARLFYVATSRARKKLFLSWHLRSEGKWRENERSEFLSHI